MSRACLQTHTPRAKDEISGACSSASLRSGQTSQEETAARLKRRRACLELGQRKEDFELLELLGQGSYARVYKARSRHSTRQVAIKVIDKTLIATCPGLAERVRAEAETHIVLDHSSIVRLHTFFEDTSNVYFVMDLCEGGELYQYIRKRGGGLPEAEARRMFRQVVTGLQYLHSHNIAHRDLKLSNLLLTADLQVKISDFGLSVVLRSEDGESGTMCGTPNYMSPEVISSAPHGLPSDLWSLGCLLYTMLVGVPPFESSTVEETLLRISKVEYRVPPHVSPPAAHLISRLLLREPSHRMSLDAILQLPFMAPPNAIIHNTQKSSSTNGTSTCRGSPTRREGGEKRQTLVERSGESCASNHHASNHHVPSPPPLSQELASKSVSSASGGGGGASVGDVTEECWTCKNESWSGDYVSHLQSACDMSQDQELRSASRVCHTSEHETIGGRIRESRREEGGGVLVGSGLCLSELSSSTRSDMPSSISQCSSSTHYAYARAEKPTTCSPSPYVSCGMALRDRVKCCGSSDIGRACGSDLSPGPHAVLSAGPHPPLSDAQENGVSGDGMNVYSYSSGWGEQTASHACTEAACEEQELGMHGVHHKQTSTACNKSNKSTLSECNRSALSRTLLCARTHVIPTPAPMPSPSAFESGGGVWRFGERERGAKADERERESSCRRSAQYSRPSTPSQASTSTPRKRDSNASRRQDKHTSVPMHVIDSRRMKANVYESKGVALRIDADGGLHVSFKRKPDELLILPGGTRVAITSARNCTSASSSAGASSSASPTKSTSHDSRDRRWRRSDASYSSASASDAGHKSPLQPHNVVAVESLGGRWRDMYEYVRRMICVIQCNTPLIVYYSPRARACLMNDYARSNHSAATTTSASSSPPLTATATFQCHFYSGVMVQRAGGVNQMHMHARSSSKSDACVHTRCDASGLVLACGGGLHEQRACDDEELLAHAKACLDVCTGVADSLFGCTQQAAGWQGGGGGGCVEYPVVMAHKQAMHRLEEEAAKHRLQEQSHDHSHEQHHRHHHTPLQRQQKQQQQKDEEQEQQEEGQETGSSLKRYSLNTTGGGTPLVAPSSAGNTAGASVGSDLCQHSTTSQLSRASRASTIAASGSIVSSPSLPSPSHTCHVCRKGIRGGGGLMDGAADASQSLIARSSPRAPATSSQAVGGGGGGRGDSGGGADYSDLRLAGSGRLFEFGEGSGRPVVEKTAFFHAFGWVMWLEDGCMWAQLVDGSQVSVTHCDAVHVDAHGAKFEVKLKNGRLEDEGDEGDGCGASPHPRVPPRTFALTQHLIRLRDVL